MFENKKRDNEAVMFCVDLFLVCVCVTVQISSLCFPSFLAPSGFNIKWLFLLSPRLLATVWKFHWSVGCCKMLKWVTIGLPSHKWRDQGTRTPSVSYASRICFFNFRLWFVSCFVFFFFFLHLITHLHLVHIFKWWFVENNRLHLFLVIMSIHFSIVTETFCLIFS